VFSRIEFHSLCDDLGPSDSTLILPLNTHVRRCQGLSVPVENATSSRAVEQPQVSFVIRLGRSVVFFSMNLARMALASCLLRFVTREVEGWRRLILGTAISSLPSMHLQGRIEAVLGHQPTHPLMMNPMTRDQARQALGDESDAFLVGPRLALNSSFVALDHDSTDLDDHQGISSLDKTQSIPIQNRMKRSPSELQLREDEELADFRDYVMFSRIVDRMSRSQKEMMNRHLRYENDVCLAHVIKTRNGQDTTKELQHQRQQQQQLRASAAAAAAAESSRRSPSPILATTDPYPRVTFSELDNMLVAEDVASALEEDDDDYDEDDDIMFDLEL